MAPDSRLLIHVSVLSGATSHTTNMKTRCARPVSRLLAAMMVAACTAVLVPAISAADSRDHDKVRRAVESGEIRTLSDILSMVRDKLPGEITGVEAEQKKGRWLYEFRVVDSKGRLFDVYVDAKSGEIDRIKEK
jgi:uncharacterized membrane protein YkoI